MRILAYETLNSNPTGKERLFEGKSVRWVAEFLATDLNGVLSSQRQSVQVGNFTWYFQIFK
jgi:hypothetical protein